MKDENELTEASLASANTVGSVVSSCQRPLEYDDAMTILHSACSIERGIRDGEATFNELLIWTSKIRLIIKQYL